VQRRPLCGASSAPTLEVTLSGKSWAEDFGIALISIELKKVVPQRKLIMTETFWQNKGDNSGLQVFSSVQAPLDVWQSLGRDRRVHF
jgi:hypothetical protein